MQTLSIAMSLNPAAERGSFTVPTAEGSSFSHLSSEAPRSAFSGMLS